jgi:hypothetical protein
MKTRKALNDEAEKLANRVGKNNEALADVGVVLDDKLEVVTN